MDDKVIDGFSGTPVPLLKDILESTTVLDVVHGQLSEGGMVRAEEDENVLLVCERLADNHVSSLPVFSKDGTCLGIVDFSDAVAFLLKMNWETPGSLKNGNAVWGELGSEPISKAIDLSERNPKVEILASSSLLEATRLFKDKRLRRAVVATEAGGPVVAILSPSAVVKYLMGRLEGRNDSVMHGTVAELVVGHSPVQSVKKTQAVLEAMHLMHQTRHSVVAVVDPSTGALAGSISMSDIKMLFQTKRFSTLVMSCWQYIVESRERSDNEVFPFFGVQGGDRLQMVVSKLLATNVHHLYVVNDKNQPERVISFTDVCATLCDKCV